MESTEEVEELEIPDFNKESILLMHMEGDEQEANEPQVSDENEKGIEVLYSKSEMSYASWTKNPSDVEYERQVGTNVANPGTSQHSTLNRHRFRRSFEPRYIGSEVYYDQVSQHPTKSLSSIQNNNEFLDTEINHRFMFLLSQSKEAGKSSFKKPELKEGDVKRVTFAPGTQFVERDEQRPFWRDISQRKEKRLALLINAYPVQYKKSNKKKKKRLKLVEKINEQYSNVGNAPVVDPISLKKKMVNRISSFILRCFLPDNNSQINDASQENQINVK